MEGREGRRESSNKQGAFAEQKEGRCGWCAVDRGAWLVMGPETLAGAFLALMRSLVLIQSMMGSHWKVCIKELA